jgi:hypothetical protein
LLSAGKSLLVSIPPFVKVTLTPPSSDVGLVEGLAGGVLSGIDRDCTGASLDAVGGGGGARTFLEEARVAALMPAADSGLVARGE